MGAALPVARFIHDAALTLLFGGLLFPLYAMRSPERSRRSLLLTTLRIEAVVAVLSAVAVFALSVGSMAGSLGAVFDFGLLKETALSEDFGWLFLVRTGLLTAVLIGLAAGRTGGVVTALAGLALAGLALTGHAREGAGWRPPAHVALDAVHLLTAGLWLGALPWFAVLLRPNSDPSLDALAAVRRFSAVAAMAVAALLATGVAATWMLVDSPLALLPTTWGRLLILKAELAMVMVVLAALNRWRVTPGIAGGSHRAAAALRRNAKVELLLGMAVLAVVGLLGTLPFDG
ncbi:hypothetical protein BH09PSE2_BH09PSE2_11610 [soil metagenome]